MRSGLFLFLAVLSLSACKSTPDPKPSSDSLVTLTRGRCMGRCPAYSVTVSSAGAVEFTPESSTLATEKATATLNAAQLEALTKRLGAAPFSQWKDAYEKATTTDLPTVSVTFAGRTIRHNLGDETAPAELVALENDLDALIGTGPWTTGAGAPAQ